MSSTLNFLQLLDEDEYEFENRMRRIRRDRINRRNEIIHLKYIIIKEKNLDLIDLEYQQFKNFHIDKNIIFGIDLISRILIHDDNRMSVLTRAFIYTTDTYTNLVSPNSKLCIDCKIELRQVLNKPPLLEENI